MREVPDAERDAPRRDVPDLRQRRRDAGRQAEEVASDERAPWHFKLLVVMTVVYLVWRFFQILT